MLNKIFSKQDRTADTFRLPYNFFQKENDVYRNNILSFQKVVYDCAYNFINQELQEGCTVLDIGNGGVINCDYKKCKQFICADLFINKNVVEQYKEASNVIFMESNILDLHQFENNFFDVIIVSYVLHHLAGKTRSITRSNFITAISECKRVVKPDGKIIIIEAVVFRWFEILEIVFYPIMQAIISTLGFGYIYQYSLKELTKLFIECKTNPEITPIKSGKYTWIMNMKIPTILNPTRTFFFKL